MRSLLSHLPGAGSLLIFRKHILNIGETKAVYDYGIKTKEKRGKK